MSVFTLDHLCWRISWWALSNPFEGSERVTRDIFLLSIVFLKSVFVTVDNFGHNPCWLHERSQGDSKENKLP